MRGALILNDLHAHAWPRFSTTNDLGQNSRFMHLMRVLHQVEQHAIERAVHTIIIAGDLTHRRYYVPFGIYTVLGNWIQDLVKAGFQVIALVGNHDIESRGVHSLGPLRWLGANVIDRPTTMYVSSDLGVVRFVPYMHEGIAEAVQDDANDPTTLITHYAFDGKVLDSEYALPSALRLSDADHYTRIYCAHVHSPSIEQDGRVVYGGAPLHFDFGDVGPRYCWHWDERGFHPLLLTAPQFITCTYPTVPLSPEHGGFLRVLDTPHTMFEEISRAATDAGWLGVQPLEATMPRETLRMLQAQATPSTDSEALRAFIARQHPDADQSTRDALLDFGMRCLERVRQ